MRGLWLFLEHSLENADLLTLHVVDCKLPDKHPDATTAYHLPDAFPEALFF